MAADADTQVLDRVRGIALLLPEATEVEILGNIHFRIATNMFAEFEQLTDGAVATVKLSPDRQAEVVGSGVGRESLETGEHGWPTIPLGAAPDGDLVDELVIESYRGLAPEHCTAQLDALIDAAESD